MTGFLNVARCVRYLRSIGVEIDDEMAAQWDDAQRADRFLDGMKRTAEEGWDWWCSNGHHQFVTMVRGRRKRRIGDTDDVCPACGKRFTGGRVRWRRLRDGTVQDHRPIGDRWRALDNPYEPSEGRPML